MSSKGVLFLFICLLAFFPALRSQITIKGDILDQETGEQIVGANIQLKDSYKGTLSEVDGSFELKLSETPPYTLMVYALGYYLQEVPVAEMDKRLEVNLVPVMDEEEGVIAKARRVENEVESASKFLENKLNSPVAVHKLGLLSLREIPSSNFFYGMSHLPEVQINVSGISYVSPNTRGFADAQNWRFVQIVDGAEMLSPGLGFSINDIMAPSELDLSHIELIAGPASALYGPNVFNGALLSTTKSPFDYQGISAFVKGGVSVQKGVGSNPYREIGIRLAKAFGDKIAAKINFSYMGATDWTANDESHFLSNNEGTDIQDILNRSRSHPNYDALNVYGDEASVPVNLTGNTTFLVNRSGIAERDLIDYRINNFKANAALHYRIGKHTTAIYDGKFNVGDAIIRQNFAIPLRDYQHQTHKLELRNRNSFIRAYYIKEDLKNSYQATLAANYIQDQLKSNELWAIEYASAFRGEVVNVPGGDHAQARAYADRGISNATTPEFQNALAETISNPNSLTGGSKYGGNSSLLHAEANYEFPTQPLGIHLQVGGNYRQYMLDSDGNLFNDGEDGFDAPIPVTEFGAFAQVYRFFGKNERIKLQLTSRYDKNENYRGAFTPRASLIVGLDKNRKHYVRVAGQTGFRNPASLESFVRFSAPNETILGGTEKNIRAYIHRPNGAAVPGLQIFEQLMTLPSAQAFFEGGANDPTLLELANLSFLQPEKVYTLSGGYSGKWGQYFSLNLNGYLNTYENMIYSYFGYSLQAAQPFAFYSNISDPVTSYGANLNLEYSLPEGFKLAANFDHLDYNADEAQANNPAFIPAFNSPKNKMSIMLSNRDVHQGFGFSFRYRWSDSFLWQTPTGQGVIDAFGQLDGALTFRIESIRSFLKIGGSNLLNKAYTSIYGGARIGGLYYVSFTIDEFNWE